MPGLQQQKNKQTKQLNKDVCLLLNSLWGKNTVGVECSVM